MTDDQGLGDFSSTGNPVLKTPNLDAFAQESVPLTDFHVAPMCTPSRGQLLTGLAALRNGATSVTAGRTFLRPSIPTLADAFAKAGYRTGLFGKWHLGDSYPHRPVDKGFQESVYHLGWGQLHSTPEFDWPLIDGRYFHNGVERRYKGHCTDFWFDSAMAWMKDRKREGEPFLCYLATNAPHAPHIELDEYVEPYRGKGPAGFFGMIAHIDRRFGDLERFLADEGLRDDTIVIFMTDNGGTAGVATYNAGLRAGKTTLYDGGHRVPCWIRWPDGKLGEPRDINTPTQNTDLLPTLCDLCGIPQPKWAEGDDLYRGVSVSGLLRRTPEELPDRKLVVQYGQIPRKFDACVIWGDWRLVKGEELYDVQADRADDGHGGPATRRGEGDARPLRGVVEGAGADVERLRPDPHRVRAAAGGGADQRRLGGHLRRQLRIRPGGGRRADRRAVVHPGRGGRGVRVHPAAVAGTDRCGPGRGVRAVGEIPGQQAEREDRRFPAIAAANIDIAGLKVSTPADPKATGATIRVELPAGRTTLRAWFADADGKDLCGEFFVTAVRKPGGR